MEKSIVILCFLFSVSSLQAQRIDSAFIVRLNNNVNELSSKVDRLEKENNNLSRSLWRSDSLIYSSSYKTVSDALLNAKSISERFRLINQSVSINRGLISIASGQNISQTNFEELMLEQAGRLFEESSRSKSWVNVIKRLVKNEFVQSAINSNPISSAAASVLNFASTFFFKKEVKTGDSKNPNAIVDTPINSAKIDTFINDMHIYTKFFEQIDSVNKKFDSALSDLQVRYKIYNDSIATFYKKFEELVPVRTKSNLVLIMEEKYKRNQWENIKSKKDFNDLSVIITDPNIIAIYEHSTKWRSYDFITDSFQEEYYYIINDFLSKYKQLFSIEVSKNPKIKKLFNQGVLNNINLNISNAQNVINVLNEKPKE